MNTDPNKKILIVVAQKFFQDYEYSIPRKIFEEKGYKIDVASKSKTKAKGKFGKEIDVDFALKDLDVDHYTAIVLVGGPGAVEYQNDQELLQLLQDFNENERVIAAICIAPTILALGGLLQDKKATVWNDDGAQSNLLQINGAEYQEESVVVDGRVITANGPDVAEEFANKVIENIEQDLTFSL